MQPRNRPLLPLLTIVLLLAAAVAPAAAEDGTSLSVHPRMGSARDLSVPADVFEVEARVSGPVDVEEFRFTRVEAGTTRVTRGTTDGSGSRTATVRFDLAPGEAVTIEVVAVLAGGAELRDEVVGLNAPMPEVRAPAWTTNGLGTSFRWTVPEGFDEEEVDYLIHCPRNAACHAAWSSRSAPEFDDMLLHQYLLDGFAVQATYPGAAAPSAMTEFTWEHFGGVTGPLG